MAAPMVGYAAARLTHPTINNAAGFLLGVRPLCILSWANALGLPFGRIRGYQGWPGAGGLPQGLMQAHRLFGSIPEHAQRQQRRAQVFAAGEGHVWNLGK